MSSVIRLIFFVYIGWKAIIMLSVLSNLLDIGNESHVGAIHESVMLSAIRRALNIGSALSRGLSSFPFDTSFFSFYTGW